MVQPSLLIRADASTAMGAGHVMRCLALAQAWQDKGGNVTFLMTPGFPSLEQRIHKENMTVFIQTEQPGSNADAEASADYAKQTGSSWIVVDGYQFGATYQKKLKELGTSVLFIDDYGHSDHYYADIVLNQNVYADMSYYTNYEPYTEFLLGTRYALLRREFLEWSGWCRDIPDRARKILVTFGGGDPDNVTLKIIEAMRSVDLDRLEVKVVVGSTNPHFDLIRESAKNLANVTLIKNAENMPALMAWADAAISGGGSTCMELAFMGLPSIIIPIADNQKLIAQELDKIHAAIEIPPHILKSTNALARFITPVLCQKKTRSDLSLNQRKLVDGTGAKNIVSLLWGDT